MKDKPIIKLDAFDWWCVKQNVEYAKTEGLEVVAARLRANGYPTTAAAVEAVVKNNNGKLPPPGEGIEVRV